MSNKLRERKSLTTAESQSIREGGARRTQTTANRTTCFSVCDPTIVRWWTWCRRTNAVGNGRFSTFWEWGSENVYDSPSWPVQWRTCRIVAITVYRTDVGYAYRLKVFRLWHGAHVSSFDKRVEKEDLALVNITSFHGILNCGKKRTSEKSNCRINGPTCFLELLTLKGYWNLKFEKKKLINKNSGV